MDGLKPKGKHPEKVLTATSVRAMKRPGRYADGNGLYLIVDDSGAKRWCLRTVIHGKRCDLGLGGVGVVSLAQAREESARLRRIARAGGDPLAERRSQKRIIPTFEQAARQVHESHSETFHNDRHKDQWINTLVQYVFPVFGARRLDHVEPADVLKALSAIWLTTPETARRVRQRIKTIFDWAKAAGYRSGDNPVEAIAKALPRQRDAVEHHASLSYEKVPEFIQSLRLSESGVATKLSFEFLILTATRTNEVLKATWDEFDLEEKTWTIPRERMKTRREFRVPLAWRCIEILEAAKKISNGGAFVFPSQSPEHPLSNMVFLMTLRRGKHSFTAHGFRSSFRNWAAERTNYPREVCEMALAHALKDKTEAAYNRTDLFDKRRKLMAAWETFVVTSSAKVVSMRA